MATIKLNKKYHCSDDCSQGGCPTHEAELEYMSVTDSYTFKGRGGVRYFETNELETLIKLMVELSEIRLDAIDIKKVVNNL